MNDILVNEIKWAVFTCDGGNAGYAKDGVAISWAIFGAYPLVRLKNPDLVSSVTLSYDTVHSRVSGAETAVESPRGHWQQFNYKLPDKSPIVISPVPVAQGGVNQVGADRLFKRSLLHRCAYSNAPIRNGRDPGFGSRLAEAVMAVKKMWDDAKVVMLHIRHADTPERLEVGIDIDITPSKVGWEVGVRSELED